MTSRVRSSASETDDFLGMIQGAQIGMNQLLGAAKKVIGIAWNCQDCGEQKAIPFAAVDGFVQEYI
jgi:hypothetical protein